MSLTGSISTGFTDSVGREIFVGDYITQATQYPTSYNGGKGWVTQVRSNTKLQLRASLYWLPEDSGPDLGNLYRLLYQPEVPQNIRTSLAKPTYVTVITPYTAYRSLHNPFEHLDPLLSKEEFAAKMLEMPTTERHRQQLLTDSLSW